MDLYQRAIKITEPACAQYLRSLNYYVNAQPKGTDEANLIANNQEILIKPDLLIFLANNQGNVLFVEVKAYKEYSHPKHYFKNKNTRNALNDLTGIKRFQLASKNDYMQGLDESDYKKYRIVAEKLKIPVVLAYNDNLLKTYNDGSGIWYGISLEKFDRPDLANIYNNKTNRYQRYIFIRNMHPLEKLLPRIKPAKLDKTKIEYYLNRIYTKKY